MPFNAYLKAIRENLQRGDSTEHTHRPALKDMVEALEKRITATNEPKRVECGAPDYVVSRSTKHGPLTIGYIEAKDVGKSLDEAERSDQIKRYLPLGNLILTDYLEFRWYVEGKHRQTASLGRLGRDGKIVADKEGQESVNQLLTSFLDRKPPPIDKPKDLAERLARLTYLIRDIIEEAFEKEQASTIIKDLHRAFEEVLIPDLAIPQFADMFAQTLAYGLFAARCNHQGPPETFTRQGAASEIPKTNPFLRKLFEMITGTALDEEPFAGFVNDLVQLLRQTDIDAVLADFGKRTRREDPIIHFYETFLAEYNPKERRRRGIYYTPEPVVSYIVRSIDHLLKTRFGCPDGLADTATVQYTREDDEGKEHTETAPRVLILDPACGTGTFLYTVVDLIREEFMRQGDAGMWSGYVQEHLLPRLFGFELLMAPYAVAHLKLGMQLAGQDLPGAQRTDWAYDFEGDERLGVYLTNTLEEAERRAEDLFGPLRVITEEANAASEIKHDLPIMVVLGNPPYSVSSANKGEHIEGLMERYKAAVRHEQNIQPLSDDYIKFIRFSHDRVERTGHGVIGMITNHAYLSGLVHRGMREELMKSFDEIYVLNLHGSILMGETAPDGSKDENVFDIRPGVAIALFVSKRERSRLASVKYWDLWGLRDEKYRYLLENDINTTEWRTLEPESPHFFFVDKDFSLLNEYEEGWSVAKIFSRFSTGVGTGRDSAFVSFEPETARSFAQDLRAPTISDEAITEKYGVNDTSGWNFFRRRKGLIGEEKPVECVVQYYYRPYDVRFTFYHPIIRRDQRDLMKHMMHENLALILCQQQAQVGFRHVFSSRNIVDESIISTRTRERGYVFPCYLYSTPEDTEGTFFPTGEVSRANNLLNEFVTTVAEKLGLEFVPDGAGDLKKTFGPEDIFHYIYAIFHSPTYRSRYAEFLKIDFPRLPLTSDKKLFADLAEKGRGLVGFHLMESPALKDRITHYPVTGDHLVEKGHPKYFAPGDKPPGGNESLKKGRVYISRDNKKTGKKGQYFEGVPPEVWEFHVGGYQVCNKWLKDRRGRILSYDDRVHYQKIVVALCRDHPPHERNRRPHPLLADCVM